MYLAMRKLPEAMHAYRESFAIVKKAVERRPNNARWGRNLSLAYISLGDMHEEMGRRLEALHSFQEGFAIIKELAEGAPDNVLWQKDLLGVHNRLAKLAIARRMPDEARLHARSATEVLVALDRNEGLRDDAELLQLREKLTETRKRMRSRGF